MEKELAIVGAIGVFIYMLLKDKSTSKSNGTNIVPNRYIIGYNLSDKEFVKNQILSLGGIILTEFKYINYFGVNISDNLISEVSKINGVTSVGQEQLMALT